MCSTLFQPASISINFDQLAEQLHLRPTSPLPGVPGTLRMELQRMLTEALPLAHPKVAYRIALVEHLDENTVSLDGVIFTSRILRSNLEKVHRIFAFVATCGRELLPWAKTYAGDMLTSFWADAIMEQVLYAAWEAFEQHLQAHYQPGALAAMNPGSLEDFPLSQQTPMFQLIGDVNTLTGVELTDSMLMIPAKSISGVLFATDSGYSNCQLCPREVCPNRRAAYQPGLMQEKYGV
jgi:hypothetical protein